MTRNDIIGGSNVTIEMMKIFKTIIDFFIYGIALTIMFSLIYMLVTMIRDEERKRKKRRKNNEKNNDDNMHHDANS